MFVAIVFVLTLVMIGLHAGEWVLLGRLAQATKSRLVQPAPFPRILKLLNFLRLEAAYYVILLVFWLVSPGAVPGAAVLLLGAVHLGSWLVVERRKSLPQLEAVAVAARNPEAPAGGTRLRRLLAGIAAFDAVEVVVLGYLAYRLWPLL